MVNKMLSINKRNIFLAFILLLILVPAISAILNRNTPFIRIRVGANNNTINTVIYNAGIPSDFIGVPGLIVDGETISTNAISGGSGAFTVRYITDVNAKGPVSAPLTGAFSYDSSTPMSCITAFCVGETISFTKIKWTALDGDTLNTVLSYDATANQVYQIQTDISNLNNQSNTRHRNFYQYAFINDTLLPAGEYLGTVTINGEAL